MPPSKTHAPALEWTANSHALTSALINVLTDYPDLKSKIWPAPGIKVSGKPKTTHYQEVANRLLAPYDTFIKTAEGQKTYGKSVGAQLRQMGLKWRRARDALGVTGAGLKDETDIWDNGRGDMLRNIWTTVKQSCPYFYALKPLLGERMLITDHAIQNSIDPIDTSSLMTSRRPAIPKPTIGPGHVLVNDNEELDASNINSPSRNISDGEEDQRHSPRVPTPSTRSPTPATQLPTSDLYNHKLGRKTATPVPSVVESGVRPKSSQGLKNTQVSEFAQLIGASREGAASRKRLRDESKQETRQLEIERKFDLAEKRLQTKHEANMRRIALEEKKLAIEERKVALQE
ncbi:hypothetical protein MMC29_004077 [Sticta canariensis]|nr:hypothetical protein [Sticta canariensis]